MQAFRTVPWPRRGPSQPCSPLNATCLISTGSPGHSNPPSPWPQTPPAPPLQRPPLMAPPGCPSLILFSWTFVDLTLGTGVREPEAQKVGQ